MKQPNIKVGLLLASEIHFQLIGKFSSETIVSEKMYKATVKENKIQLEWAEGSTSLHDTVLFKNEEKSAHFLLNDVLIGIDFHWEQKKNLSYRGDLILKFEEGKIRVINSVPLEEYLKSVISSEMSSRSSLNLLKAHAVISRSWLVAQVLKSDKLKNKTYKTIEERNGEYIRWYDREDHEGFDVCADDHCQRYQGITEIISENANQAISETFGEFLVYGNEICDARFSKCCGGVSENFHSVWEPVKHEYLSPIVDSELITDLPLLQDEEEAKRWIKSKPIAFCNTTDQNILTQVLPDFDQKTQDFYRWRVEYSQKELSELIYKKTGVDYGTILGIEALDRGSSGRIIKLKIKGTNCTKVIGKELEIRRALSKTHLYSSAFVVKTYFHDGVPSLFELTGAGWGHGVGLCQIGAAVMGAKGYSYQTILQHYFKDTKLEKRY
ncbi:MAG: SpoIID/LytB domain-containing protein [Mangrovibacterium sp.]